MGEASDKIRRRFLEGRRWDENFSGSTLGVGNVITWKVTVLTPFRKREGAMGLCFGEGRAVEVIGKLETLPALQGHKRRRVEHHAEQILLHFYNPLPCLKPLQHTDKRDH